MGPGPGLAARASLTAAGHPWLNESVTEPTPPRLQYDIKQLELVIRSRLEDILDGTGVTAWQYTALTVLERRPAMTSADLARASFVRAQSAADLVGALERHGLIQRSIDPAHQRRMLISLTDAGRDFLKSYAPRVAELEETMLRDLDAAERDTFRGFLDSCRRSLTRAG